MYLITFFGHLKKDVMKIVFFILHVYICTCRPTLTSSVIIKAPEHCGPKSMNIEDFLVFWLFLSIAPWSFLNHACTVIRRKMIQDVIKIHFLVTLYLTRNLLILGLENCRDNYFRLKLSEYKNDTDLPLLINQSLELALN